MKLILCFSLIIVRLVSKMTSNAILPDPTEYQRLILSPDSPMRAVISDFRGSAIAAYGLLLQIAHPTVGAGVEQFSSYRQNPWPRLFNTADYVMASVYGDADLAGEVGARVRNMHKSIKGTKADGSKYHALEPEAFAWVHATLFQAYERLGTVFIGAKWDASTREQMWEEWIDLGRFVGVRSRDLPATYSEYQVYFDDMVANKLIHTKAVDDFADSVFKSPPAPPLGLRPIELVWPAVGLPAGKLMQLFAIGLLPGELRERLGFKWSRGQQMQFNSIAAMSRMTTPVVPRALRVTGDSYLTMRRNLIENGKAQSMLLPPRSWQAPTA